MCRLITCVWKTRIFDSLIIWKSFKKSTLRIQKSFLCLIQNRSNFLLTQTLYKRKKNHYQDNQIAITWYYYLSVPFQNVKSKYFGLRSELWQKKEISISIKHWMLILTNWCISIQFSHCKGNSFHLVKAHFLIVVQGKFKSFIECNYTKR